MNRTCLAAAAALLLLGGGCAKRPVANRIVFIASSPPPTPAASLEGGGVLTVAEPQPPEPETGPEAPLPEPPDTPQARPRARVTPADPVIDAEPEPAPAVEVPLLEPLGGPGDQVQRQRIQQFQDRIRGRISRQENTRLSADDHRMLNDARTFLSQSQRALGTNDFQRALTLARKAAMLLAVIEQQ